MFEGARSGTPEQAVARRRWSWSRPASRCSTSARSRRRPGRRSRSTRRRRRWCRRSRGWPPRRGRCRSPPTPSRPRSRGGRWTPGAVAVNDISGGVGRDVRAGRRERLRLRADAHRGAAPGRPPGARVRRRRRPPARPGSRGESSEPLALGVAEEQIAIDPGLDFDLSTDQDLEILRRLGELGGLGLPLYVSLSRKDFIGAVLAGSWEERWPAGEREWGTVAAVALAVRARADILRIHDRSSLQAIRVAAAIGAA